MHRYTRNQSYVGSSGQTLTTNVSMTLLDTQIRHQTHVSWLHHIWYQIKIRSQINTVPTPTDKGVAYTGGGGGGHSCPTVPTFSEA